MKQNVGVMPMSCYAQIGIGPNALRTKTLSYCGTAPLWEEAVQFGIRGLNPRRITAQVYAWVWRKRYPGDSLDAALQQTTLKVIHE
jgi:hypothetical protein